MERNLILSVNKTFYLTSQKSGPAIFLTLLTRRCQGWAGVWQNPQSWQLCQCIVMGFAFTATSKERNICVLADCASSVLRDNPDIGMHQERNRDIHNVSESWQPWAALVTNPLRKDLLEMEHTGRWALITVMGCLLLVKWLQIIELGLLMLGRIWVQGVWSPSAQLSCGACCWAVAEAELDMSSNTARQINRQKTH